MPANTAEALGMEWTLHLSEHQDPWCRAGLSSPRLHPGSQSEGAVGAPPSALQVNCVMTGSLVGVGRRG